jgi:dihydrofolate reductase
MKAIIAVNNLGYIGKDNTLIWKSIEDLKHFKDLTYGKKLIVGYNTSKLLPKLSNREVIIDDESLNNINIDDIDWCVGGKYTYEKYCHLFTELHISHIDNNDIGDTMFPDLRKLNKNCKIFNYFFK